MLERNAQKRLSKHPRGHRVPIFLDVEDQGATPKEQLPFIVAVLAPLSGDVERPSRHWAAEKGQEINRNNFDKVLAKIKPKLSFSVASKLTGAAPDEKLPINLEFAKPDDFEPAGVAGHIPALQKKLILRQRLRELMGLLRTDTDLRSELETLLRKDGSRKQIRDVIAGLLDVGESQKAPEPTL